jgi:hypothetical protein
MGCYKETGNVNSVRNLAGTMIWVSEDFPTAVRKVWTALIFLFGKCKKMGLQSLLERRQNAC